jgi:hypothetical protein
MQFLTCVEPATPAHEGQSVQSCARGSQTRPVSPAATSACTHAGTGAQDGGLDADRRRQYWPSGQDADETQVPGFCTQPPWPSGTQPLAPSQSVQLG